MGNKILKNLEDDDHPSLGPTLYGLKLWGMWQPKRGVSSFIYNLVHISAIMFVLSQYVELWIIRSDLESALRNLSVTMLSSVCVVKAGTFVLWQKHWKCIFDYVSTLEKNEINKNEAITCRTIKEYIEYSRKITYIYWCLVTATVFGVILAPLASFISSPTDETTNNCTKVYPEIMSSWLPFDKTHGIGYLAMILEQTIICFYGGGIVANYDSNAVVLMSFFFGQLKLLKLNCERAFEENSGINSHEYINKIRNLHKQHSSLVKYSKILNSLLSPVMFLYVIICSLMICASAVQLTTSGISRMQQIRITEYLLALIAQLFIYCWHSNEVSLMSLKVDEGVYASAWWSQNTCVKRNVLLLMGKVRRNIIFTAGPFTSLSVPTFVAVLKGSYSYYTLLSKREN
ncbi:PREDICTED: odorant receptor 4-like [Papilio xuthus]|uniref:Odorant receptor n=1 Tax=Papilio xuthus TaxID=66420 RepID=A0AAJ6Z5U9_PAPXU|nr:PREDICTED: odorant receptor 4-like [Papilio xuthus]WCC57703.1 odorant receptor 53 [Papilio xuthus]